MQKYNIFKIYFSLTPGGYQFEVLEIVENNKWKLPMILINTAVILIQWKHDSSSKNDLHGQQISNLQ